jgi:hypothetical protein
MFGADRFHPSAAGYFAAATTLLSTVVSLARGTAETEPVPVPADGVRSLAQAAAEAVDQAGTEVSGATVAGLPGPVGRWAALRHRLRARVEWPRDPAEDVGEVIA